MIWSYEHAKALFKDKCVWITGTFDTWDRDSLIMKVVAAGARCTDCPHADRPEIVLSGMGWHEGRRAAIGLGAEIWTEGQLVLHMDSRSDFPLPAEVPCGERLNQLPVAEEGHITLPSPGEHSGHLVLKWKKVAFSPHRRFLELFGFEFDGQHQYLGQFFYQGEPLKPAEGSVHGFCAESFVRSPALENGVELDGRRLDLLYSGEHGFNCTPLLLSQESLALSWSEAWPSGWKAIAEREPRAFGALSSHTLVEQYWVDLEAGLWKVDFFAAGAVIDPKNPQHR